jgi:hypothetical protein
MGLFRRRRAVLGLLEPRVRKDAEHRSDNPKRSD